MDPTLKHPSVTPTSMGATIPSHVPSLAASTLVRRTSTCLAASYESLSTHGGKFAPVTTRLASRCMGTLSESIPPLVFTIPMSILFMVIKLPMELPSSTVLR